MTKRRDQGKIQRDKQTRRDLARLKSKGLYRGSVLKKPTRYGTRLTKLFSDVLTGKAAVVKVRGDSKETRKLARESLRDYREHGFRVRRNRVIVDRSTGDQVFYNKRVGKVERVSSRSGERRREFVSPGAKGLPKARKGKKFYYTMPFGRGPNQYRIRFDSFDELQKFMQPYESKSVNPFLDWHNYVIVEELDNASDESDSEE